MKMKDVCRICARELCGNQRRWIFHAASKLNLLLSHAVGCELIRDGRGEFACSKCAFMLDRMYRFDTVIARVEALSLDRLHRLLLEKDRLRQSVGALYRKHNAEDRNVQLTGAGVGAGPDSGTEDPPVDLSELQDATYTDMIQDDLVFSEYESWADKEDPAVDQDQQTHHGPGSDLLSGKKPRRCRGCTALRVTDSDYEAVCKIPRRVGRRSTSCGPSTHYSGDPPKLSGGSEATPVTFEAPSAGPETDETTCDRTSPSSSVESLDTAVDLNHGETKEPEQEKDPQEAPGRRDPGENFLSVPELLQSILRSCEFRPARNLKGSKIPRLLRDKHSRTLTPHDPHRTARGGTADPRHPQLVTPCSLQELEEVEDLWADEYIECGAFRVQQGGLGPCESAAGQRVDDVHKAQDQDQVLQTRIRDSETRSQALDRRVFALQQRDEQQRQKEDEDTQKTIRQLRTSLQIKETLLQDYSELLEQKHDPHVLHTLHQRTRDLEQVLDEKFRRVEEKEAESRQLHLLLREKERDVERLRSVLAKNEETISALEVLLRARSLTVRQTCAWWRNVQQQQQLNQQRQNCMLSQRDAIISQLQDALHACTQEAQDLRGSMLAQIQTGARDVVEELKVRLHLKDRLFQEVLADRTRQAQEHQDQVQDLLNTIRSRDQHIQDSARQLGKVMSEQTARLQELRRQLSSGSEVRSRSVCEPELQEEEVSQAAVLASLTRTLRVKDDIIKDLQRTLVDLDIPLQVEDLTERPPQRGDLRSEDDDEDDDGDDIITEEEESMLTAQYLENLSSAGAAGGAAGAAAGLAPRGTGGPVSDSEELAVEGELLEVRGQLEEAGFSSLSHIRKTPISQRAENKDLKHQLSRLQTDSREQRDELKLWEKHEEEEEQQEVKQQEEEEEEEEEEQEEKQDVTIEWEEKEEEGCDSVLHGTLCKKAEPVQQQSRDLQDLGYETCGRSENEAEREDTSSPEFDDLEMCTSLDCSSLWWPASSSTCRDQVASLQQLVEDLRAHLSRSQGVIRGLQSRLRSLSTSSDYGPSTPRKVYWSFQALPSQSGGEEDEGWQSLEGDPLNSHRPFPDKDFRELASRVGALEDHLKTGVKRVSKDSQTCWSGKFDSLIQAQARELSHLRQRLREGRGVCHILTQHLGDTTKAFEELLRANDIDYDMGQSFREQLAHGGSLAQRVSAKIRARDHPEDPEEKTELLAIWLSKELQQKDQLIESLQAKLNQHHSHSSDTPHISHAPSETTDQSDCISYVSDEQGFANEDVCSESELLETEHHADSSVLSQSSSHTATSCPSCPSMQCSSSPHKSADSQTAPASVFTFDPCHPQSSITQGAPLPFDPATLRPRCHGNRGVGFSLADVHQELQMLQRKLGDGFSAAQSQCVPGVSFLSPQSSSFLSPQSSSFLSPQSSSFLPPSYSRYQTSPLGGALGSDCAVKGGAVLLESGALWDMMYDNRPMGVGSDVSAGSSAYQSGAPPNIYVQDSLGQIRLLKEENTRLQNQLKHATTDGCKEAEQLREAVLLERAKLKEAELQVDRWAEQSRKLQTEVQAQREEITHLRQDRQRNQETINRLQHELCVLQQQVCESHTQVGSLQLELQMFHRVRGLPKNTHSAPSSLKEQAPVGSSSSRHGRHVVSHMEDNHVVGHMEDFQALQQQILEASALLHTMEAAVCCGLVSQVDSARKLQTDTETLIRILEEAQSLLRMFWRATLPNSKETKTKQDDSLKEEVASLHLKLSEKDRALRDAMERLRSANMTKANVEHAIISQLSRTRDVLKKAKTNLQVKGQGYLPSLIVGVS